MFVNCFLPFALAHRVSVTIQKILLFPILCCYFGHLSQIFIKPFVKNHTFNLYFSFPLPHNSEQVHGTHLGDSKYSGSFFHSPPFAQDVFMPDIFSVGFYPSLVISQLWQRHCGALFIGHHLLWLNCVLQKDIFSTNPWGMWTCSYLEIGLLEN